MANERKRNTADAIDLLRDDHDRLQQLFDSVAGARRSTIEQACAELKIHFVLEAELLYPAARAALGPDGASIVDEAEGEHDVAARLVAELERMAPADLRAAPTFAVLAACVRHHLDNERDRLFPVLRDSTLDIGALAAALHSRKEALLATESPGQPEPSAEAEGAYEPELDEALARRLAG